MSSASVTALGTFTSSDVADALIKLKVPYGGFLQGISMYSPERETGPAKIFGPAFTVKFVRDGSTTAPAPRSHFVDLIPKGSVAFLSQHEDCISSLWGGLMSTRAQVLGCQGVVIDGFFRDINEHKELGFPLFARGSSPVGSQSLTRPMAVNISILFEPETNYESHDKRHYKPMKINPGDLILADADGVVVIPPHLVEQCLELCRDRSEIDKKTKECLLKGEAFGPTISRLRK